MRVFPSMFCLLGLGPMYMYLPVSRLTTEPTCIKALDKARTRMRLVRELSVGERQVNPHGCLLRTGLVMT